MSEDIGESLCLGSRVWGHNGCSASPASGSGVESWIIQAPVLPAWMSENLESAADGRAAEAPDGEAVSGDIHKMPCGLCKMSSVSWDVFTL